MTQTLAVGGYAATPYAGQADTGAALTVTVTDLAGVSDTASSMFLLTVTDQAGVADVVSRVASYVRTVTDPAGSSDLLTQSGTFLRTITDTAGVTDTTSDMRTRVILFGGCVTTTEIEAEANFTELVGVAP